MTMKDIDPTATSGNPAIQIVLGDKDNPRHRRYAVWECQQCGLVYWVRHKAAET